MKKLSSKEIRKIWLDYFVSKGHFAMESSSLIPVDDKSLLWINAGVSPIKGFFDGSQVPPQKRLTNIQKCIRTNDIENVGKTARHQTFFEMMGNFSIGDYFKKEAIEFAYELLTSKEYFDIDKDLLYITYYPTDTDSYNYWIKCGVAPDHIVKKEDNFWEIGTGPCGPDSEVHFDRGSQFDSRGVELLAEDIENDRFIEIWNIVFSQYNSDPELQRSQYQELPHKNIDTGAGLERFACIFQNVNSNFETDLFTPIIRKFEEISGIKYEGQSDFKIIADHIRSISMAMSDGAVFSNEGRGYILKRLLRRASSSALKLGINKPFLSGLVDVVVSEYSEIYPNLSRSEKFIKELIYDEESKYLETLKIGNEIIQEYISQNNSKIVSGEFLFKLYDTYGVPLDIAKSILTELNYEYDEETFQTKLNEQINLSRKNRQADDSMKSQVSEYLDFKEPSEFLGYDNLTVKAKVIKVFKEGVVFDKTPFYATMGGQECDTGKIGNNFRTTSVIKLPNGQHLHKGSFRFQVGTRLSLDVNLKRRFNISAGHTATHLLHAALRQVFGQHVEQKGSFITEDYFRFDFNQFKKPTDEEILQVESIVKQHIKEAIPVVTEIMNKEDAIKQGATALFEMKYDDVVRVVKIGDVSTELCGGTHLPNTAKIQEFLIKSCSSIGSGIFRIEAIAGNNITTIVENSEETKELKKINSAILHLKPDYVPRELVRYSTYSDIQLNKDIVKKAQEDLDKFTKEIYDATRNKYLEPLLAKDLGEKAVIYLSTRKSPFAKEVLDILFEKNKMKTLLVIAVKPNVDKVYYIKSSEGRAKIVAEEVNKLLRGFGGGNPNFASGGTKQIFYFPDLKQRLESIL